MPAPAAYFPTVTPLFAAFCPTLGGLTGAATASPSAPPPDIGRALPLGMCLLVLVYTQKILLELEADVPPTLMTMTRTQHRHKQQQQQLQHVNPVPTNGNMDGSYSQFSEFFNLHSIVSHVGSFCAPGLGFAPLGLQYAGLTKIPARIPARVPPTAMTPKPMFNLFPNFVDTTICSNAGSRTAASTGGSTGPDCLDTLGVGSVIG